MPQYSLSRLLTVDETAEYLGVSSKTVDRHRTAGKITFLQDGRWIRIRFSDLLNALERWTRKAKDDTARQVGVRRPIADQDEGGSLMDAYKLASSYDADAESDPDPDRPRESGRSKKRNKRS